MFVVIEPKPLPFTKILVRDALKVGEEIEPRVLEVLPAALLHFPRHFIGLGDLPHDLVETMRAINARKAEGPDFRWVKYKDALRWANHPLKDGRTKPVREHRINKTLRLHPSINRKLAVLAKKRQTTETDIVEQLIRSA